MISKSKIEEAARKYSETQCQNLQTVIYTREELEDYCYQDFLVGYSFAEKELENLAVEFAEWILQNNAPGFKIVDGDGLPNKWGSSRQGCGYKTTKELFEIFKQEKYGNT